MSHGRWAVAFCAAAFGLVGCTSAVGPNQAVPSATETAASARPENYFALPLDAYRGNIKEAHVFAQAEYLLVTDCLVQFGLKNSLPKPDLASAEKADEAATTRLYGITDLGVATTRGYHLPPGTFLTSGASAGQSAAEEYVYTGTKPGQDPLEIATTSPGQVNGQPVPPGGCIGQARVKIYGRAITTRPFEKAGALAVDNFLRSKADPRVAEVVAEWSKCMKEQGYNYEGPLKVENFDPLTPTVTKEEIQTATADVGCKTEVDLPRKWHAVLVEYDLKAIEKNQLALTEELAKRKAALARAAEVVTEP